MYNWIGERIGIRRLLTKKGEDTRERVVDYDIRRVRKLMKEQVEG